MTEAELQATIIEACELHGFLWHHETDSRRSNPGWPDLDIIMPDYERNHGTLWKLELKGEKTRVTPEQRVVMDALATVDTFGSAIVRPADLDQVLLAMERKRRRPQ